MQTQSNTRKKSGAARPKPAAETQPSATMPEAPNEAASAQQVVLLDVGLIDRNPGNPRTSHDEQGLRELAESILRHGVLQPITVRPVEGRYHIVCGERRYMATLVAERQQIPAFVCDYSEDQALEVALIENLQRLDISPVEEAAAFARLMELRKGTVEDLSVQCGKSEAYVRSRLQLRSLVAEAAGMLQSGKIVLGAALALSQYPVGVQAEVCRERLDEGREGSWLDLPVREFARLMERAYATALDTFPFDKTGCAACPSNSANGNLFLHGSACGNCTDPSCLRSKLAEHLVRVCTALAQTYPEATFFVRPQSEADPQVVAKLEEMGFEVIRTDDAMRFPVVPVAPAQGELSDAEYADFMADFEKLREEYELERDSVWAMIHGGGAIVLIEVGGREPVVCYRELRKPEPVSKPSTSKGAAAATVAKHPAGQPSGASRQAVAGESIVALENKEMQLRIDEAGKVLSDVKTHMIGARYPDVPFSAAEERAMYFVLLAHLRADHCPAVGFPGVQALSEAQRFEAAGNLTPEQKILVLRDFIVTGLCRGESDVSAGMLMGLATNFFPGEVGALRRKWEDKYARQRKGIRDRIAAIQSKNGLQPQETPGVEAGPSIPEMPPLPAQSAQENVVTDIEYIEVASEMMDGSPCVVGSAEAASVDEPECASGEVPAMQSDPGLLLPEQCISDCGPQVEAA